jgi:hypothetical protein
MSASTQVTNINKQETMRRPRAYLGPPPLTAADDANAYYRVYDKIAQTQDNIDIMSEIWMVDITDLTIEVLRYRRMKATVYKLCAERRHCHSFERCAGH